MRIVVTSDSHRASRDFFKIIERHKDTTDIFVNLGDSEHEIIEMRMYYPKLRLEAVRGNCDFSSTDPLYKAFKCGDKKVLITHGHMQYVKHGYQNALYFAKQEEADIILFGHTHIPYIETVEGVHMMNPGAVCQGSYGIIDIEPSGIMMYHNKI
jgi:putative phosphoesterase